ncbi:TIGR03986 family CRISPR-associated RAMP protein [Pseudoalteromonas piscicida]|uniref:TIGR03986 family type III CRISPR-associated RAMP protein n=1 Tax=Pseudoalteromonas piscicida TaxID=43662 RepID=UPI001D0AED5C|nr:TIGR03986 family CRISPR-associated RAMP protein [Pseudoalteromonas piscicida]UDM62089.1 TIGR03986 family CRISPR-associated RAMP protein [Pseudoalteromonas piscicida]
MSEQRFLNPYNFIPFSSLSGHKQITATRDALQRAGIGHDRFVNHSGKITCCIEVESPLFYGNLSQDHIKRINNKQIKYKELLPYLRSGLPAIPANSLRGPIAQHIEMLSGSGPRVLENSEMTYRGAAQGGSLAMGVITKGEGKYLEIQPIGLPPTALDKSGFIAKKWQRVFVDGTKKDKPSLPISQAMGVRIAQDKHDTSEYISASQQWKNTCHLVYDRALSAAENGEISQPFTTSHPWVEKVKPCDGVPFSRVLPRGKVIRQASADSKQALIRKGASINGKYDMAYPIEHIKAPIIAVSEQAVAEFILLMNSSEECRQNKKQNKDFTYTTKNVVGTLVFFDCNEAGDSVTMLAKSQLWRKKVPYSLYDFLPEEALQPYSHRRTSLSVAEQILGVVSDEGKLEDKEKISAYASRVRFYDAKLISTWDPNSIQSRYLVPRSDSPKLPCPSMYFYNKQNRNLLIKKSQLDPEKHGINGPYKVYLRHPVEQVMAEAFIEDNVTEELDNRTIAPLLPQKAKLEFEVHFTNLRAAELELLLTALEPDHNYSHQLGMGKPHGFGQVKISIEQIELQNMQARYTSFSNHPVEQYSIADDQSWSTWLTAKTPLKQGDSLICETTLGLLTQVGDRNSNLYQQGHTAISYPTATLRGETAVFNWFTNNDHNKQENKQTLKCLGADGAGLLLENQKPKPKPKPKPKNNRNAR